jgi:hypothetical protein
MAEMLWLGRVLSLGGVLETAAGVGLLVAPAVVVSRLLSAPLAGAGVVVARIGGGGLLALGIACWGARASPATSAGIGVAWAFLVYNLVVCATLARARPPRAAGGGMALSAAVLHGALGGVLLVLLLRGS